VRAAVRTVSGSWAVDLETEEVEPLDDEVQVAPAIPVDLPLLRATAGAGSTIVAVLDRRPPLAVSHDAGVTWREAGGGLPAGRAVAVAADDPDLVVYAARNRVYVSQDGGRFWRALAPELPEIQALAVLG
jgi:hypothetical protein